MKRPLLLASLYALTLLPAHAEPPVRSFEPKEGAASFPISPNLIVSADKVTPELDPATASIKSLTAEGDVLIRVKPTDTGKWLLVACDRAVYDLANDQIKLTGWPAVKQGVQLLKATDAETYVLVSRKSGKWEIKGPHKLELNLGALKK